MSNIDLNTKFDRILKMSLPYIIFSGDKDKLKLCNMIRLLWRDKESNKKTQFEETCKKTEEFIPTITLNSYAVTYINAFNFSRRGMSKTVDDLAQRVSKLEEAQKAGKLNQVDAIPQQEKKCLICEGVIDSERRNAIYCSNKCKMVAYRKRKK